MKISLLIPTLNEIDGMRVIMPRIKKEWYHDLLIVDGRSTDGTIEYAKEHRYPIIIQKKRGPRHALLEAVENLTGDVIITFSPDGNCIPELIPACIAKIKEGYDMVIVSRYADGAKSYDDNPMTKFGNVMANVLINSLHGGHYIDSMGIYRAYKKSLVYDLQLDKDEGYVTAEWIFHTIISWEPLLSIRCAKRKLKVAEIPGDEPARIGGVAKLQPFRWGGSYLFQIFREKFIWK